MKKKSVVNVFFIRFIKSLVVITLLLAVGWGSYSVTMYYYKEVKPPKQAKSDSIIKDIVADAKLEDFSKNLIYKVKSGTGEITGMVLEVFHAYTYNMDYITIPSNIRFTISNDIYERLCVVNKEIPQIVTFNGINQYLSGDSIYEYGVLLLEDLLDLEVSYYTVMEESIFDSIFTTKEETINHGTNEKREQLEGKSNLQTMQIARLSKQVIKELELVTNENQLKDYISMKYQTFSSNLTLKRKLKYLEQYMNIKKELIYYHTIFGEEEDNAFKVQVEETNRLLKRIEENSESYSEPQQQIDDTQDLYASSIGLSIRILNGSNITGLAAKYKDILSGAGYTISGIANYDGEIQNRTVIQTKDEGNGQDLKAYFNDAAVETIPLGDGIDIQIILGTADDQ